MLPGLGLGLGFYDKVSVSASSRYLSQVSASVSEVTVSTTSLVPGHVLITVYYFHLHVHFAAKIRLPNGAISTTDNSLTSVCQNKYFILKNILFFHRILLSNSIKLFFNLKHTWLPFIKVLFIRAGVYYSAIEWARAKLAVRRVVAPLTSCFKSVTLCASDSRRRRYVRVLSSVTPKYLSRRAGFRCWSWLSAHV